MRRFDTNFKRSRISRAASAGTSFLAGGGRLSAYDRAMSGLRRQHLASRLTAPAFYLSPRLAFPLAARNGASNAGGEGGSGGGWGAGPPPPLSPLPPLPFLPAAARFCRAAAIRAHISSRGVSGGRR